jgi:hypothetical protein
MKIIKQREYKSMTTYDISFGVVGDRHPCFIFPCDQGGNVNLDELMPIARENLAKCRSGEHDGVKIEPRGIHRHTQSWWEPAIGLCNVCGTEVALEGDPCTCPKCNTDYNSAGQQLAPRSQWGEETGESLADILGPRMPGEEY